VSVWNFNHLEGHFMLARPDANQRRILRIPEVLQMTGISRSQVYNLAAIGLFPKSITLAPGGKAVGWLESEVNAWIDERINARNGGAAHEE